MTWPGIEPMSPGGMNNLILLSNGLNSTSNATSKGMDCYQLAIGHIEVRPDRENKTQFLPSSDRVDTAVWMQYMDAN